VTEGSAFPALEASDAAAPGTFQAIFRLLEDESAARIGRMQTRFLVIPLHGVDGAVSGGFWGCTNFGWLHVQMLFVPPAQRGMGIGAALLHVAEREALARHCRGAHVDTFSFQAAPFYEKCGYTRFGVLPDFPPGYSQHYYYKRLAA
jgi:GNAT superfamily N-acetyltransferase